MNVANADRATTRAILVFVGIAYARSIGFSLIVELTVDTKAVSSFDSA